MPLEALSSWLLVLQFLSRSILQSKKGVLLQEMCDMNQESKIYNNQTVDIFFILHVFVKF